MSNRFANALRDRGIKKGDRVFIMLPRIPEWYVAMLGLMKLGALPMPGTTLLTPNDIEYRVKTAEAVMVITDDETAGKAEAEQRLGAITLDTAVEYRQRTAPEQCGKVSTAGVMQAFDLHTAQGCQYTRRINAGTYGISGQNLSPYRPKKRGQLNAGLFHHSPQ